MAKYFRKHRNNILKLKAFTSKVFVFVFVFVSLFSCNNSDNIGDLLGQWKLDQVTYNDVTTNPDDLYLRFQSQYVEAYKVKWTTVTGHYTQDGNTMSLKFYYPEDAFNILNSEYNFYNDASIPRTQEEIDKNVNPLNVKLRVETLTSDNLVLVSDNGRWVFSKW